MIAFGSSITSPELYESTAKRGILRAAEADSPVFAFQATGSSVGSMPRTYNLMLEKAAALDDLEALVLVLQDIEILDPRFCQKVRSALSDPEVAVVGCVGALLGGVSRWEGSVPWESFVERYRELSEGRLPAAGEAEIVDGSLFVLSPWAVRNLRFDEALGPLHGWDFDFCLQVREAGRKVVSEHFELAHQLSLDTVTNPEIWVEAHMQVAEKWQDRMPNVGSGTDWKHRARRAEAEAAAARLLATSTQLQAYAHAQEHGRSVEAVTASRSWRITEPLRKAGARRPSRQHRS